MVEEQPTMLRCHVPFDALDSVEGRAHDFDPKGNCRHCVLIILAFGHSVPWISAQYAKHKYTIVDLKRCRRRGSQEN